MLLYLDNDNISTRHLHLHCHRGHLTAFNLGKKVKNGPQGSKCGQGCGQVMAKFQVFGESFQMDGLTNGAMDV